MTISFLRWEGKRQDLSHSAVVVWVMFPQNSAPQHTQTRCSRLLFSAPLHRRSDAIFIFFVIFLSFIYSDPLTGGVTSNSCGELIPLTSERQVFWSHGTSCVQRAPAATGHRTPPRVVVAPPRVLGVCILRSDSYIESLVSPSTGPLYDPSTPLWECKPHAGLCSGTRKGKLHFISVPPPNTITIHTIQNSKHWKILRLLLPKPVSTTTENTDSGRVNTCANTCTRSGRGGGGGGRGGRGGPALPTDRDTFSCDTNTFQRWFPNGQVQRWQTHSGAGALSGNPPGLSLCLHMFWRPAVPGGAGLGNKTTSICFRCGFNRARMVFFFLQMNVSSPCFFWTRVVFSENLLAAQNDRLTLNPEFSFGSLIGGYLCSPNNTGPILSHGRSWTLQHKKIRFLSCVMASWWKINVGGCPPKGKLILCSWHKSKCIERVTLVQTCDMR